MSQPETLPLLKAAHQAMKAGQKERARALLQEASRLDPADHRPWLWLAGLASSPEASLRYIAQAEARNSGDPAVAKARTWAEKRLNEGRPSAPPPPAPPERKRRLSPVVAMTAVAMPLILLLLAGGLLLLNRPQLTAALAPTTTDELVMAGLGGVMTENDHLTAVEVAPADEVEAAPAEIADDLAAIATPILIEPKNLVVSLGNEMSEPRGAWTPTPSPTPTPTPTPTPLPSPTLIPTVLASAAEAAILRPSGVGPNERWIDVNLTTQTLTAYEGNTAVRSTLISSGLPRTPTVTGQFRIYLRYTAQDMNGYRLGFNYYLRDVPYVQYFYGNYGLHGTYWHNNFGQPMSHGCVNLPTPEAEWLFNWASIGTLVWVHY
jgi:lipoprotein-anchoring transpeptidase ErfK/SrfK